MTAKTFYKNKKILITGGVGSIGSQLVKRLLTLDPAIIRVFDNNETGLFDLEENLNSGKIRTLIGDIRDKDRLTMAMEGIDIVFHASALKHVPLCEYNPFDAVKTNVLGTQNVLEAALINEVDKVINISTDKAVSPTNVMGATKLLAERLTISANYYRGNKPTVFSSVRFGNVLNSRGSVIPLFNSQIKNSGPVTITDTGMTRFFMDIPAAINLILTAGEIAKGREIFILKMPALRIVDLAEIMIEEFAPKYGFDPHNIAIKIIGKRNGEKLHEDLMAEEEVERAYERDDMFLIAPHNYSYDGPSNPEVIEGFRKTKTIRVSSKDVHLISKRDLKKILSKTII
ncbi:MAG: UDP-N-acetylglucosamine 4,6-dehydratase family protein [Methanoregula sp.]